MKRIATLLDVPTARLFCGHSQLPDNLISEELAVISAS
jgi:hypothetical protein